MGEAFDEGYSLIVKLNEACLLELDYDFTEDYVKLHDVIRDMALWIVSECGKKKNKWIVGGRDDDLGQFSKWEAGNWQETELISFNGTLFGNSVQKFLSNKNIDEKCQVSVAATSPRYPNLQSLFMVENSGCGIEKDEVLVIHLFPHMPSLTHLNLSGANISGLSKEIQVLVNLQYLNISATSIRSLPPELEELKQLKYFFFSHPYFVSEGGLVPIKADGLSALSRLPELHVLDLYEHTCLEAGDLRILMDRKRIKAISMDVELVEILRLLKDLPTWKINLRNIHDMPTLQLCDLSYKCDGESLMELQISDCGFEDLLINGSGVSLKHLQLNGLAKLKQITRPAEAFRNGCFPKLTYVSISDCDSLRSLSWVLHLPCLRTLQAWDCSAIEELIDPREMQQASSGLPTFPNLHLLFLYSMPNLVSLSTCSLDFPVLSVLMLKRCPKLKKLPFKSSIVNNKLKIVDIDGDLWESLEWEDTTIRSHLAKFL
ncbi:disease resistance protein RPS2-like [Dioscorea cayenensis subsp. rotundata]|uniref:Disease resistance protein RPS2-like n=1 Tax=Dioscorea cayennensis subsp. rotundata TaxID=55577 RepID=A0AB40AQT7_DIOCR|nr:disease resistance protein RPS2-like [Dioscorea cayenensis subsp. rotundata]